MGEAANAYRLSLSNGFIGVFFECLFNIHVILFPGKSLADKYWEREEEKRRRERKNKLKGNDDDYYSFTFIYNTSRFIKRRSHM